MGGLAAQRGGRVAFFKPVPRKPLIVKWIRSPERESAFLQGDGIWKRWTMGGRPIVSWFK